ncbi:Asp23/Gls24 family envelope stress response protein [Candidatus Sumerlaeota bacterium]|nr:Asp23/Gls24 family envelope stress response protein [Candidatus Sumerlaeota bacterium]
MAVTENMGNIVINEEIAAHYASLAILEVDGVVGISGKNSFSDYVGVKTKDVDKGITVTVDAAKNSCVVNVEVNIEYGINVYEAARRLQNSVKNAIENYVGYSVSCVNVTIKGLVIHEEPVRDK